MKEASSSSWTTWLKNILAEYDLPGAYSLYEHPPGRKELARMVKSTVHDRWTQLLIEQSRTMSSMKYLKTSTLMLGKLHGSLKGLENLQAIQKIAVTSKILLRRYPLASNPTSGTRRHENCPMCDEETEDEKHFLLHCKILRNVRLPFLLCLFAYCLEHKISRPRRTHKSCGGPHRTWMPCGDPEFVPQNAVCPTHRQR